MKVNAIATIVCMAVCAPLFAQQSTSKTKPLRSKSSATAETAKTHTPDTATTPEKPFAPVLFVQGLPVTSYAANDPIKVYEWLGGLLSSLPGKPDQFSTSEERRAYDESVAAQLKNIGQIPMISQCTKKYNGDLQQYEVKTSIHPVTNSYSLKAVDAKAINLKVLTLKAVNVKQESYTAQNGYGAETQISKTTSDNYAIAFPYAMSPTSAVISGSPRLTNLPLPYELDFGYIKFDVPMASAEARANDKDIACLFIVSLAPPYMFKHTERSSPTRSIPFENIINYHAIYGRLDQVLVINKATGDLYEQASRP